MKRLGVNQQLHELFNRVLNKPEHENKTHHFGNYIFAFSNATKFLPTGDGRDLLQVEGFNLTIFRRVKIHRFGSAVECLHDCIHGNQFATDLAEAMGKIGRIYKGDKIISGKYEFRSQFTAYLNYLDMSEKLGDKSSKQTTKNKI